jgi:hypothetical protein
MTDTNLTTYEKAYAASIWNRKRAVEEAREALHARAAEKGLLILDESLTFTIQSINVPPIEHTFGERPGYAYWIIRAQAGVVVPA